MCVRACDCERERTEQEGVRSVGIDTFVSDTGVLALKAKLNDWAHPSDPLFQVSLNGPARMHA